MTNKDVIVRKRKQRNQTAHVHAMNDPRARKGLSALKSYWDVLSRPERIEQVNNLLELGCSLRGISEETNIPLSTLRRHIARTKSTKPSNDPRPETKTDLNTEPQKLRRLTRIEAARESKAMFQELKASPRGETDEKETAKERSKPLVAQTPIITAADPALIAAREPSQKREEVSREGSQSCEGQPRTGQRELCESTKANREEKLQRLLSIPDQLKPRPTYSARSLKRQGA